MNRHAGLLILSILLTLTLLLPAYAQTDDEPQDPFLAMLANVPDYEASRNEFSYANFQAIADAWGVSDVTLEDVLNQTEAGEHWSSAMMLPFSISLPMASLLTTSMPDMQPLTAFTMLDVYQVVHYGWPPVDGYVLAGEFDPKAIRTALAARDFEQHDFNGIEVWCWIKGCDQGIYQDLQNINQLNIFGGALGRREPLAIVSTELVLDSAGLETIIWLAAAQKGAVQTLADAPEYRALAETLAAQGTLLQLYMVDPGLVRTWDMTTLALPLSVLPDVRMSARTYFGDLPPYQLFAFAHVWRDDAHLAQVILLYDDETTAEIASKELHNRLSNAMSFQGKGRTYRDLFNASGEILPPAVYTGEDFAAAIVSVQAAPTDDPAMASEPYGMLIEMLMRRDLYFLGTDIIQASE